MNIRIGDVVHHEHWMARSRTLCGEPYGPGVAFIEYNFGGTTQRYLGRRPQDGPGFGTVVEVPPDGLSTEDAATCVLCLVELG